jgi:hypothetical protein
MVHHIVLCSFLPEVNDERVEWVMRQTRIRLLKIAEIRAIKCGKRIEPANQWGFFFAADYESMEKLAIGQHDPVYQAFVKEVVEPNVADQLALSYEMEPDKDVRYS